MHKPLPGAERSSSNIYPSPIVTATSAFSLIAATLLASYWPVGDVSGQLVKGLAMGGYARWPLWVWAYCIGCWLIQVIYRLWIAVKSVMSC